MTFYAYFLFFTNHFPIIINLLYTSLIHVLLFTSYLIFFVQDCLFLSSLFPFKQSLFPAFISTIFMTNRRHCVFFYPPFLDVYHLLRFPSNALLSLEIRIEQLFFPTFLPPPFISLLFLFYSCQFVFLVEYDFDFTISSVTGDMRKCKADYIDFFNQKYLYRRLSKKCESEMKSQSFL